MNMDYIDDYLRSHLKETRYQHTLGVRDTAVQLAEKFGEDLEKAELAALLHDCCKSIKGTEMNQLIDSYGLSIRYHDNNNLAHSKLAAEMIPDLFGIDDEDILQAVRFHTTGRPGMSTLEEIVFLADSIEPGRAYPGVDELREVAFQNLDQACLLSLKRTVSYLKEQGTEDIDEDTLLAEEYFEKIRKENTMDIKECALFIAGVLDEKRGRDIVVIDVATHSSFADYLIVASGGSMRQVAALADDVEDRMEQEGYTVRAIEGKQETGWVLMDYGDIIVNIFTEDTREKYNIEKIWGDCETLELGE